MPGVPRNGRPIRAVYKYHPPGGTARTRPRRLIEKMSMTNHFHVPSERPPFLTAEWRNLLLISFEIPPELVLPYLPHGLEIDLHAGKTYVSLVAFQFQKTKLRGWCIPWHQNFPEVNLRFYVRRRVGDEIRRGVVFIKEIVPRRAVSWVARFCYNEPYVTLPMRDEVEETDNGLQVKYQWQIGNSWCAAAANATGSSQPLRSHSLEEFIAEHYWGYGRQRSGVLVEYHVSHPPWRHWQPTEFSLTGDFHTLYGAEWGDILTGTPASAFLADGSAVMVYPPE